MQGREVVAKPLSGQVKRMAETYETGTNDIGRVGEAVTVVGCSQLSFAGREEAHTSKRERKEWNRRLATFCKNGVSRTPVEFSKIQYAEVRKQGKRWSTDAIRPRLILQLLNTIRSINGQGYNRNHQQSAFIPKS